MQKIRKMKNKFLIIFFFLFQFNSQAQTYFNKSYRLSSPDSSNRWENFTPILETPGSGFLVAGYTENYITGSSRVMINNLDYNGNVLTMHLYGDTGYFYQPTSMEFTNDSNVILNVVKGKNTNPYDSLWMSLYKLDISGNLIWSREYSSGLVKTQGVKAIETADKGFAILGWTAMSNNLPIKTYMIKTDSLGNKEWDMYYGDSANYVYDGTSLLQESDGGYVLMGIIGTNGTYYRMITIMRTDSAGNKLWQHDYGLPTLYAHGEWITKLKDGNYLISGQDGIPFGNTNGLLIKTDTLGNVIWQKHYGFTQVGNIRGVVENPDGTICFHLGQLLTNPSRDVANLYKVNSNGDSLWSRQYVYDTSVVNNYCYAYYMTSTSDGGYIICGQENQGPPPYSQDAWLVKVDSLGCLVPGCSPVGLIESDGMNLSGNISLFPNPSSGFSNIKFPPGLFNQICELSIIDIFGKTIYSDSFLPEQDEFTYPLRVGNLASGIYLVKVKNSTREFSTKLLRQ